ncbi:MAG: cobalamin biosynthesis protein, partial [Acidimicrobiales bacterium]
MGAAAVKVVAVSVTDAGAALAARLPYEHRHGSAAEAVRGLWGEVDGLVLMLAVGAAARIIAPLLADKRTDPAVVCVDHAGRWAVPVAGGHAGANDLARDVAALLGAEAVITTATDAAGVAALDDRPGWVAEGDVAGVTAALLDGRPPAVEDELPPGWPRPADLAGGPGPHRVVLTDRVVPPAPGTVALHPPTLVAGVGTSSDALPVEARAHLASALAGAGLAPVSVGLVATIDRRASHPAVTGLGHRVVAFPPEQLAAVPVPHPSPTVAGAVGTPSVAEAAALLAAGDGAELVVTKTTSPHVTVAVARRARPAGGLSIVGLGPGGAAHRTPAAAAAVRAAEVVIGYTAYVDAAKPLLGAVQDVRPSPIGAEPERARAALAEAL